MLLELGFPLRELLAIRFGFLETLVIFEAGFAEVLLEFLGRLMGLLLGGARRFLGGHRAGFAGCKLLTGHTGHSLGRL